MPLNEPKSKVPPGGLEGLRKYTGLSAKNAIEAGRKRANELSKKGKRITNDLHLYGANTGKRNSKITRNQGGGRRTRRAPKRKTKGTRRR